MNLWQSALALMGFAPGAQDGTNLRTGHVTTERHSDAAASSGSAVLGLSTAWACVNLLAGTIGSLPIMVYRATRSGVDEEEWDHPLYRVIAESPNADQTPLDFFEFSAASVELHGNAFSRIERAGDGRVIALDVPVSPERMAVRRASDGVIEYEWQDGGRQTARQDEMLHVRGFGGSPLGGLSTLSFGRKTFGLARTLENSATATFRNGMMPSVALETDEVFTREQRIAAEDRIAEKYQGALNSGRPYISDRGLKIKPLSFNAEDSQMLESRGFSVEEVCRFFGTPPHMIGHTAGNTQLGSSIEQQTLGFVIFTLRRRLKRFEQAMAKQLLTSADRARGLRIKFDLRGLMRGDSKARAEFYQMALRNGWMTINEVRALEGLPPVEGGNIIRMQMQNVPITELMGENAPFAEAA